MKQHYRISKVYVCNPEAASWQACSNQPGNGYEMQPDYGMYPADYEKPQKKERHWIWTALPIWLGIIAVFAFLVWPRQLTGYTSDGKKAVEVNYTIWSGTLNSIEFYDQQEKKSGVLKKRNEWGTEAFILTETTDREDTYTEYLFVRRRLCDRYDFQGPFTRKICYDANGFIADFEENGSDMTEDHPPFNNL